MKSLRFLSVCQFLWACPVLASAGIMQWILISGANPFERPNKFSTIKG